MKNLNLVLVLTLLTCYSGFGSTSLYPSIASSNSNCHSMGTGDHAQNQNDSDASFRYLNEHVMNHGAFRCCFESLTNAPQKDHMTLKDLKLEASFIGNTNLYIYKSFSSSRSASIREHDPPDLYVSNSSLLL
jgi:hypothetical protein